MLGIQGPFSGPVTVERRSGTRNWPPGKGQEVRGSRAEKTMKPEVWEHRPRAGRPLDSITLVSRSCRLRYQPRCPPKKESIASGRGLVPSPPTSHFFSQRGPPDASTTSPGPVFHRESSFDGPGAGKRPLETENVENPPLYFCVASICTI